MFFNNVLAEVIGISVLYFFDSYTLRESDDLFNCYYGRQRLFPTHTCARSLYIDDAKRDLRYFSRELGDIQGIENMNIDVGGFLTFADYFFDGFLADVMVQSKINNAKRQVDEAIRRVENVLGRLRTL